MEYISLCKPERRVTCVSRTGWHGQVYVPQDEVSGEGAEGVILQTTSVQGAWFPRVGHNRGMAGERIPPLYRQLPRGICCQPGLCCTTVTAGRRDGGGYHLKGESTDGKTTTMKAATSVCGGPDYWRYGGPPATRWRDAPAAATMPPWCLMRSGKLTDARQAISPTCWQTVGQGAVPVRTVSCVPVSSGACCSFQLASCLWPNMRQRPVSVLLPGWKSGWSRSPAIPGNLAFLRNCTASTAARLWQSILNGPRPATTVRRSGSGWKHWPLI